MNCSDIVNFFDDSDVKRPENEAEKLLTELRDELDIAKANGKPFKSVNSLSVPKTMDYFRTELKNTLLKSLDVGEKSETVCLSEIFQDELNASLNPEYNIDNLPLTLLQFFVTQAHEQVYCKRAYLMRWKQFTRHTKAMELTYPRFRQRVTEVMNNYRNSLQRCERLAHVREMFVSTPQAVAQTPQARFGALSMVTVDDVLALMRWMVSITSQLRPFQKYFTACQWIPQLYVDDLTRATRENIAEGYSYSHQLGKIRRKSSTKPAFLTELPTSANASRLSSALPMRHDASGPIAWGPLSKIPLEIETLGETVDDMRHLLRYLVDWYSIPARTEIDDISSTGEYGDLFVIINDHFTAILNKQEQEKKYVTIDSLEELANLNSTSSTFLMTATWQEHAHFKPHLDSDYETLMTDLKGLPIDELLNFQSNFLKDTDSNFIKETYKSYLKQTKETNYPAARVMSNQTDESTLKFWRKINDFSKLSSFEDKGENKKKELREYDENSKNIEQFGPKPPSRDSKSMQKSVGDLLHVEEEEADPGVLCLSLLKHLKIRENQRSILSVLNYFRSMERTLTIESCGLTSENQPPILKPNDEVYKPPPILRATVSTPKQSALALGLEASALGLGRPHYIYNTPKDFVMSEVEFMEVDDIANHSNFYTFQDGRIHVIDEKGFFIMYDVALEDFKQLENDLLRLATRYVKKWYQHQPSDSKTRKVPNRMALLYDFWTLETEFQDLKRELFDLYYEAYLNAFNRDVRLRLVQILVDLQHRRPRFSRHDGPNPTSFIQTYRLECEILRKQIIWIRDLLKNVIESCREKIAKIPIDQCKPEDRTGLPFSIELKQPVTVHLPKTAVSSVDMLEFHQIMSHVAQFLPSIIDFISSEFVRAAKVDEDSLKTLRLELFAVECLAKEWRDRDHHGETLSNRIQTDVIFEALADDPCYLSELSKAKLASLDGEMIGLPRNDQSDKIFSSLCRVLGISSNRHRLILQIYESEVLNRCYKLFSKKLNFEPFHLTMHCHPIENAVKRENASFVVHVPAPDCSDEDFRASGMNKLVASSMSMAVQEMDENQIPKFSFRQPSGMKALLDDADFRKLQTALTCQIAHKNLMTSAVLLMYHVHDHLPVPRGNIELSDDSATKSKSSFESDNFLTRKESSAQNSGPVVYKNPDFLPESFVSIQLEKMTKRMYAHNWFVDTKIQMGFAAKNPVEFEKLVANTVVEYSRLITERASLLSLKAQLIAYYTDILQVLQDFPTVRQNFFQMGYFKEVKKKDELLKEYMTVDPLTMKTRPRTVFSSDGQAFMNLWFIPFPTEILQAFTSLPDDQAVPIFHNWLRIISCLHDLLLLFVAFAKLGIRSSKSENVAAALKTCSAEWGGAEGIGAELFEIQCQLNNLGDQTNAEQVASFLELKRKVLYLHLEVVTRHQMRDALMRKAPEHFQNLSSGIYHNLPLLVGIYQNSMPTVFQSGLDLPEPLECRESLAKRIYPYRVILNHNGPFTTGVYQYFNIIKWFQGCFCRLNRVDRLILNGELMSLTLTTEEILKHYRFGYANVLLCREPDLDPYEFRQFQITSAALATGSRPSSSSSLVRPPTTQTIKATVHAIPNVASFGFGNEKPPTRTHQPVLSLSLIYWYLRLWRQLEVFKNSYMKERVQISDWRTEWTRETYENALQLYCSERFIPIFATICNLFGDPDLSMLLSAAKLPKDVFALPIPQAVSDIDVKCIQLAQLIRETMCQSFSRMKAKLQKDLNLVLNEKAREEEDALPTDLWKKSGIQENFTLLQPQLVENFTAEFFGGIVDQNEKETTVSNEKINKALNALSSGCMEREKFCFESYSSFYETLLRQYHQELYAKEREIEALKNEVSDLKENSETAARERMAIACRDLLLEVTDLRLKVDENENESKQDDIRLQTKLEFSSLVEALGAASMQLRTRFDGYRMRISEETEELINEAKNHVLTRIRENAGNRDYSKMEQKDPMDVQAELEGEISTLREQNKQLENLVSRLRSMDRWRMNSLSGKFNKKIEELEKKIEKLKKTSNEHKIMSNEEVLLLRQQQVTLKKAVAMAERETTRVRAQLDKETRFWKEKDQSNKEQMEAQEKSHKARTQTFFDVVTDLDERNVVVRHLAVELENRERATDIDKHNAARTVRSARTQLVRERELKQQAIGRLGDLAKVVSDMESVITTAQYQGSVVTTGSSVVADTLNSRSPTRASTATIRHISSTMAAQFASSRPSWEQADELESSTTSTRRIRPTTASIGFVRSQNRNRPQTAASLQYQRQLQTAGSSLDQGQDSAAGGSYLNSSGIPPAPRMPQQNLTSSIADAQQQRRRNRAKSAKNDAVRFNLLSDLDKPTFDQIRNLTRSKPNLSEESTA